MEKHKLEPNKRLFLNIRFVIVIIICAFLAVFMLVSNLLAEKNRNADSDFTTGWTTDRGETVDSDDIVCGDYGGKVRITNKLPQITESNEGLCFISNNIRFTVYIDGAAVYEYLPEKNLTGYGYGVAYHTIALGPELSGRRVDIVMQTVFSDNADGQIRMISLENMNKYRKRLATGQLVSFNVSVAIMAMGMLLILFGIFVPRKKSQPDISALGLTAICAGIWLANDTGFLRLVFDAVVVSRITDQLFMILWILPFMLFIYSTTRERKALYRNLICIIYGIGVAAILVGRFVFDQEIPDILLWVLLFYSSLCVISVRMVVSDMKYRRMNKLNTDLKAYFVGLAVMTVSLVIDYLVYFCGIRSVTGRGYVSRVGFVVMVVLMGLEVLSEYSREKASFKRDRVINRVLQAAVSAVDPDTNIRAIIEYFGREFNAGHTFIYENRQDGTFHNTYEWYGENTRSQLYAEYHDIPVEGLIDKLLDAFVRDHRVIIDDSETTRVINAKLYELMKNAGIKNMLVGPLMYDGDLIGIFGIDDVPKESEEDIADIIWLISYFVTQLLVQRNENRNLVRYSYFDSMTGTKNRRALEEFEKVHKDVQPYGYVMCDINGLKKTNDTEGHDAGDRLIIDVSDSLKEVFGEANVYRVGGDEFAVYAFVPNSEELDWMVQEARRLIKLRGRSASIGAVFANDNSVSRGEIKEQADRLMYEEKGRYYRGLNG